jgi:hypothetical protein
MGNMKKGPIENRLTAAVRLGVVREDNRLERDILENQISEACSTITALRRRVILLENKIADIKATALGQPREWRGEKS